MFKRLSLYTLFLCLVPFFCLGFCLSLAWKQPINGMGLLALSLTETGSVPYALITCGVFALLSVFF